jgi:protein-S-isoprenylcysteine O-methyltransferase Ste14
MVNLVKSNTRVNIKPIIAQFVITLLVYALPLFIPSGVHAWLAAWIFLALWFGSWFFIQIWLFRQNPDLFWERMRNQTSDQKSLDKIIYPLLHVSMFLWLLFTAYDADRFHWSPVPIWLQWFGAIILLCSFFLYFLTFRENTFLSALVRVQQDRGQKVISTGPYHYVRHPMYAATCIFVLGTPLLLGTWYGILLGPIVTIVLAWRSVLEERTLKKELPGYYEYMTQVKYRLIPFVW